VGGVSDVTIEKRATFLYTSKQAPGMYITRRDGGLADVSLSGPDGQTERGVKRPELQAMLEMIDAALADWPELDE
jgi:hypothetical protein